MSKYILYTLLMLAITGTCFSQDNEHAMQVIIYMDSEHDMQQLSHLGIDLNEGILVPGRFFEGTLMRHELLRIKASGFRSKVLIEDLAKWYLAHRDDKLEFRSETGCRPAKYEHYETPAHFRLGSLGGYLSYKEMLDQISYMRDLYPEFVLPMNPIGNFRTEEKRPIYHTMITSPTKNLKTQVLYTALHHAREPGSVLQMIYFMWYVLENYETDEMIKSLLDHVELHFIPCVNPDGYLYNESGYQNGRVYWRKNRRRIEGEAVGVDLNRNYGYKWGIDNTGSSEAKESQIYRGAAPFSEPETRAVEYFCKNHNFKVALNAHTYSALLITPWAYTYNLSPDSVAFDYLGRNLTKENDYVHGNSRIIYRANGVSDDWMYGDSSKPKTYAMTPEVGRNGFWAPKELLIPNCKEMLWTNIGAGLSCLPLAYFIPTDQAFVFSEKGVLEYELINTGIKKGNFKVDITPLSDNIASYPAKPVFYNLDSFQKQRGKIPFQLKKGTVDGDSIIFEIRVFNGYYTQRFQISTRYLANAPIFEDAFGNLDKWIKSDPGVWGVSTHNFTSAPGALADSPDGNYDTLQSGTIMTKPHLISIPKGVKGLLWSYKLKWIFPRSSYDRVIPFVMINGEIQDELCPRHSFIISGTFDRRQAYYGYHPEWVTECIDLSDLVQPGDELRLGFLFESSDFFPMIYDGIYIDDMKLYPVFDRVLSAVDVKSRQSAFEPFPNPANQSILIKSGKAEHGFWVIRNIYGREVLRLNHPGDIDVSNWPAGLYFIQMYRKHLFVEAKKIIIDHR